MKLSSTADSLILHLLVYSAEMSSYFSTKTNKRKVGNLSSTWSNFHVDLTCRMGHIFLILIGVFTRIAKVTFWLGYQFSRKGPRELYARSIKQRRRISGSKMKSRQNGNMQRNNVIKSEQISLKSFASKIVLRYEK